ncbi:MAG TPA: phosphoglycerate kinase, partial [Sporichthya sp.]|nr:phosphoglycerate kinase [Sporichthya sp.]
MKSIADLGDLSGKRVLVRSDLNVPLDGSRITDDGRIRASLPVIQELAAQGARVVVCAHLGRPKGEPDPKYSLAPVAHRLEELLGHQVMFSPDVVGDRAEATVASLPEGGVALLENVRFVAAETSKDDAERGAFAAQLASLADAYVGDAFGAVHRKHASVYDVARLLPHAAGDLVRTEVEVLRRLTEHPERPYAVVLGGSKVSDKLAVIERLLTVADKILVGGGMVYTFLAAQGHEVGTSLLEGDQIETVKGYLAEAEKRGVELILPSDIVVADRFAADAAATVVPADAIPADRMGLDIGPASGATFAAALADSATIFWNGPMGVFEMPAFAAGTRAVAQALVDGTAFSVVGGGDS